MRRELLTNGAGSFGALGFGGSFFDAASEFDFDEINTDPEQSEGTPVNLVLQGAAQPTLATRNEDMMTMVSSYSGRTTGTFEGSYQGQQVALVYQSKDEGEDRFTTDRAKVQGITTFVVPDKAVGQASTYRLIMNGWITDCCADDFQFEGEVATLDATGQFEGTALRGEITSDTDLGWPQRLHVKGVQVEK